MKRFVIDYVVPFAVICGVLWLFAEVLNLILTKDPADPVFIGSLGLMSFPQFRNAVNLHLLRHAGIGLKDISDADVVDFYPSGIDQEVTPFDIQEAAGSALDQSEADQDLIDHVERAPVFNRGSVWVTKYEVSRRYGGPEEGGWYYDNWSPIDSRECRTMADVSHYRNVFDKTKADESEIVNRRCNDALTAPHHFDTVTGEPADLMLGEDVSGGVSIMVESVQHMHQTYGRPRYE